jgi:uncharacterized protein
MAIWQDPSSAVALCVAGPSSGSASVTHSVVTQVKARGAPDLQGFGASGPLQGVTTFARQQSESLRTQLIGLPCVFSPAMASNLIVEPFRTTDAFLAAAGDFLGAREAEHNLIFGICSNLRVNPEAFALPPLLAVVRQGASVVMAAVMTPPWNLVLSEVDHPGALESLADDLSGMALPGVVGPRGQAGVFAELWTNRTGVRHRLAITERIFRLTAVWPPHQPASGAMRTALEGDRGLLVEWLVDFSHEALGDLDPTNHEEAADRWIAGRGRTLYLWEDGGVVSLCGVGSETPHGVRIGPVYTPARFRGRGYASTCVAAASQLQLDAGRQFCFLFTDLANATSNHIYQEIGYEPVRDVDDFRFEPVEQSASPTG